MLELTVDEVLSTTRAVRRRLDLTRPVERKLIEECLRLAQQAPTGASHELVSLQTRTDLSPGLVWSARHFAEHLHEVPVHVIPCCSCRRCAVVQAVPRPRARAASMKLQAAGLIPVAHSLGTEFRPSRRKPLGSIVHWDGWS
jgi:hypothetical protein